MFVSEDQKRTADRAGALLAAYSTEDVTGLPVLSIYGSEDGVLNMEKYEQYRANLPGASRSG